MLFAIAIDPLSINLRSAPLCRGITREGIEHKLSLYADGLLLYVSDPIFSLHLVLSILEKFCSLSGYKLNLQKSECFPINSAACALRSSPDLPFKFSPLGFRYLGVNVTHSYIELAPANFTPLLTKINSNMQR